MAELELVGLHEDGEHLVLAAADGQRYLLPIDDPLRAAVRRDRPQLEQIRAERSGAPSPREIQARVRAGQSAEQIAEESGLATEHVRRFEGPVIAEREYLAQQARGTRVGRDAGAPELGDLVVDRLASRGVAADSIVWDAYRLPGQDWTVLVRFDLEGDQREARWSFDPAAHSVHAEEDEARWLSETEIADGPLAARRRHLSAVRDVAFEVDAGDSVRPVLAAVDGPQEAEPEPTDTTQELLDDLRARRGHRQALEVDQEDEDGFDGFGPQSAFDFGLIDPSSAAEDAAEPEAPGAHPVDADPTAQARVYPVPVATVTPEPAPVVEEPQEEPKPKPRRGRAKVPSWDEIVFGAKPE